MYTMACLKRKYHTWGHTVQPLFWSLNINKLSSNIWNFSVFKYQDEAAKKKIIRLEQCARASLQRTMSSHGALAFLYGRHLKHYIKKPEVRIQIFAWYIYFLVDTITLIGQPIFFFRCVFPYCLLMHQCLWGSGVAFGVVCLHMFNHELLLCLWHFSTVSK